MELAERPKFRQHLRQGTARTDAGIRVICEADTIDDPDSKVTAEQQGLLDNAGGVEPLAPRDLSGRSCGREAVPGRAACRSGTPAAAADEQSKKPPELAVSSHLSSSGLTTAHSQV